MERYQGWYHERWWRRWRRRWISFFWHLNYIISHHYTFKCLFIDAFVQLFYFLEYTVTSKHILKMWIRYCRETFIYPALHTSTRPRTSTLEWCSQIFITFILFAIGISLDSRDKKGKTYMTIKREYLRIDVHLICC